MELQFLMTFSFSLSMYALISPAPCIPKFRILINLSTGFLQEFDGAVRTAIRQSRSYFRNRQVSAICVLRYDLVHHLYKAAGEALRDPKLNSVLLHGEGESLLQRQRLSNRCILAPDRRTPSCLQGYRRTL